MVDVLVCPRVNIRLTDLVTPLKPLEAMAQDKIVLASDVGGQNELITDGVTGTLFRADDPAALAERVLEVLARRESWPEQRARGRRYVEDERNWPRAVARYKGVYEPLLAARGGKLSGPTALERGAQNPTPDAGQARKPLRPLGHQAPAGLLVYLELFGLERFDLRLIGVDAIEHGRSPQPLRVEQTLGRLAPDRLKSGGGFASEMLYFRPEAL